MQALILAAGRGSRLGDYNGGTPKCLLEIGRRALIDHQLEAFAEAGLAPVGVVVGYCADEVKEHVGIRAEYIHNPRWEATNSIYSFWLARDWIKGPVVIVNCDVLFHPDILARLLATHGDAVAYDSSSGKGLEHMKVKAVDGRVLDMSKTLPAEEASGENVGMLVLTAETARALFDKAGELIRDGGETGWLSSAVREVAKQRAMFAVDIAGLPWGEIDSAYDLDHVRRESWPAIRRTTGKAKRRGRVLRAAALTAVIALAAGLGMYVRSTSRPADRSWEEVELVGAPGIALELPDRTQRWWLLEGGAESRAELRGPGPVRIESRLILPPGAKQRVPYVLRVKLDHKLVDLFKKDTLPDAEAPHAEWLLGRRKRVELNLPAGAHEIAVSVVGAEPGARCLLRVRQPELDQESEPEPESDDDEDRIDLAKQL
jgi:choline kinase